MEIDDKNLFIERRAALVTAFESHKLDALLITHLTNVRYLTGFTGSNAALLLTPAAAELFTDPRYTIQAAQQVNCKVRIGKGPLLERLVARVNKAGLRRVGFERNHMSFAQHSFLAEHMPAAVKLKAVGNLVETLRMVKSEDEIALIRKSVQTNSEALEAALAILRPGIQENQFAAEIDYRARQIGADAPAFETIVAAGARAALPHARPTHAVIESGMPVLVDMGAIEAGYCSDMTRMFFLGKPPQKFREAYDATLEAQLAAVAAVKAGTTAGNVDRAARRVLKAAGLSERFVHSTGHGLGLDIHEAPRLGAGDQTELLPGMVITVEPGVYFENEFGVRIEDTVVVTATGCEVLTPTPKDLRFF
jgi:Xaa-Pro aminopeptidase